MNNDWWDYIEYRNNLYHWKYVKKVGNRYFYSIKEYMAFLDNKNNKSEELPTPNSNPDTFTFNPEYSVQNENGTYAYSYFDKKGDEKDNILKKIRKIKKAYKEFNQNNDNYLNNYHTSMPASDTQGYDPDKPETYSSSAINFLTGAKRPRARKKHVAVEMHDGYLYLSSGSVNVGLSVNHPISKIRAKASKAKRKLKNLFK